jgi:hypothetical protein
MALSQIPPSCFHCHRQNANATFSPFSGQVMNPTLVYYYANPCFYYDPTHSPVSGGPQTDFFASPPMVG